MPFLTIAFPVFDPIAIAIGPIAIRWYALAYIGGIVLGWLYARSLIKNENLWGGPAPITLVQMDDFILWVTLGIILGGRTGYVLFYNLGFCPASGRDFEPGRAACRSMALGCVAAVTGSAANDLRSVARRLTTAIDRLGCFSGGRQFLITASCGAGRRTQACHGRWYFPMAGRCRAIPASCTRRRLRESCCSRSWR
jgi:phosphatidylglycerol:prolipoprotein diacylglycerol transferase